MTDVPVDRFRSTNAATMEVLARRDAGLAEMQKQIATREAWQKTATDTKRLATLKGNVDGARQEIADEMTLRRRAADAIDRSTYPAGRKGEDPAVKEALQDLKAHKMAKSSAMYGKGATATACQSCKTALAKVKNCDEPSWQTVTIGKKTYAGPMYPVCHIASVGGSPAWKSLIDDGTKTESEKRVITQVAGAEGDLATVQAWDDQAASLGAMQKTIRPDGTGELTKQLSDFKQADPARYQELFADRGWSVDKVNVNAGTKKKANWVTKTFFTPADPPGAKPMTGTELRDYIKAPGDPKRWKETLGPLKRAGEDPAFQRQQLVDYNSRLIGAGNKTPTGYDHQIDEYVTSEKGSALVLDQDVNRPGNTANDFGKALDGFYKDNPTVSRDPSTWGVNRQAYENDIVGRYSSGRNMIDSAKRAKDVMGSALSGNGGSMAFPSAPPPVLRPPG